MLVDRHLDWDGCYNVRDLGGFRTGEGRVTRRGAVVRSDSPDRLTPAGWSALAAYGVRTVVDLRNDEERQAAAEARPIGVDVVHAPLDDLADTEFWEVWGQGLQGTPLYYRPFLDRFPERCAAAVAAVAHARPGGVLIHCAVGRDRTGLITLLLLALAGVAHEEIASDYELSADRLRPLFATLGVADQGPIVREVLLRENTSVRAVVLATLESLDADAYLRAAGLGSGDLAAVRARLLTG
ncbi:tyrosine-protein phosphatase [Streptosporangium sp. NPDC049248]|uniref:tyrosine-protein phosphatase n=1 Tax=Streptosporangium sp. NPDC049248 TaxID=3155651 RepID=UPI0034133B3C